MLRNGENSQEILTQSNSAQTLANTWDMPWPPFLRAFTKEGLRLWILPVPLRCICISYDSGVSSSRTHMPFLGKVIIKKDSLSGRTILTCQLADTAGLITRTLTTPVTFHFPNSTGPHSLLPTPSFPLENSGQMGIELSSFPHCQWLQNKRFSLL